jgi:glycine hydroxymethyltransferase
MEIPMLPHVSQNDPELAKLLEGEDKRLEETLDLIAAESHAPFSIREIMGSAFNTKTIEGYPGKRFHAGCTLADEVERLAISRAKALFGAEHANVQPHSGTSANLAVYFSVLEVGDRILSMSLPHGGHLSHGHTASITSKCFKFAHYRVDPQTELIDYTMIEDLSRSFAPRMIVAGASSYPRLIDYERLGRIAKKTGAYLLVDMAHIAGLVAGGVIPSPVPHSDFVTFTCYKTMMGGRGGSILCREPYAKSLDSAVFPGCQGTSAVNMIAAKAHIFKLAQSERFRELQRLTCENAKELAKALAEPGYRIVGGGTDNHQVILDVRAKEITGKQAEERLEAVGILANRNAIPSDESHPGRISGLRLGTTALTGRGMKRAQMPEVARLIDKALMQSHIPSMLHALQKEVIGLCSRFPLDPNPFA